MLKTLDRDAFNAMKSVSECEIREYARVKAGRIMREAKDGDGWDNSTPEEALTLERLIFGAILAGQYEVTTDMLEAYAHDAIRACASTAEFMAYSFLCGEYHKINCAYSVYYPVLDWFRAYNVYS